MRLEHYVYLALAAKASHAAQTAPPWAIHNPAPKTEVTCGGVQVSVANARLWPQYHHRSEHGSASEITLDHEHENDTSSSTADSAASSSSSGKLKKSSDKDEFKAKCGKNKDRLLIGPADGSLRLACAHHRQHKVKCCWGTLEHYHEGRWVKCKH